MNEINKITNAYDKQIDKQKKYYERINKPNGNNIKGNKEEKEFFMKKENKI